MLKQLAMALAVVSAPLWATNHPEPGRFGVTGEYLYFMPSVDDTYFVIKENLSGRVQYPTGTRENNDFGYSSGYRVGAVYAFCECDREVLVNWAHLGTSQTRVVNGDALWGTLGPAQLSARFSDYAGSATSSLHLTWNRLDPLLSQSICNVCCGEFRFLLGLEYAQLKLHEGYFYTTSDGAATGTIDRNSHAYGIGPQVGFAFDYGLCCVNTCWPGQLSLVVTSTASLLSTHAKVSQLASSVANATLTTYADVSDQTTWKVLPAVHARLGLNYATTVCCKNASLEIGYEYNSYYRGLARMNFLNDAAHGFVTTDYYNFDVQGLYVSASVNF